MIRMDRIVDAKPNIYSALFDCCVLCLCSEPIHVSLENKLSTLSKADEKFLAPRSSGRKPI